MSASPPTERRARAASDARVFFDELLDRLPGIALADPEAPLDQRRGNFVLGLESLPVVL